MLSQQTKKGSDTVFTRSFGYRAPTAATTTGQVSTLTTSATGYNKTFSYTYDANGNILTASDGTNTTSYVYDSQNQLIRENNQAANKTWVWTYDKAGNILSRKEHTYSTGALSVNQDNTVYLYGDTAWGDLLTSYNGQSITYDAIGNPLTDGTWTYTWEHGRQLASMTKSAGLGSEVAISYSYNSDGMRTGKTVTQTYGSVNSGVIKIALITGKTEQYSYVYNGSQLTQMVVKTTTTQSDGSSATTTKTLYFSYDASGTPLSVNYDGADYYYVTNLQGDIVAILNSSGTAVVEYTYDAWGNILSTTGSMKLSLGATNPLRYRGYVYDTDTGLFYLQSRYYSPKTGRFINADGLVSTGQGLLGNNVFAYCSNNPIHFSDYTGTVPVGSFAYAAYPDGGQLKVKYDVPSYNQYDLFLCWAFCQIMVDDYYAGIETSNDVATERAKALARVVNRNKKRPSPDREYWDQGAFPTNCGKRCYITGIYDLYTLLQSGPAYAYYCSPDPGGSAHLVVVAGVDVSAGMVYIVNPWGDVGWQDYSNFLYEPYGDTAERHMPLYAIILIDQEE